MRALIWSLIKVSMIALTKADVKGRWSELTGLLVEIELISSALLTTKGDPWVWYPINHVIIS